MSDHIVVMIMTRILIIVIIIDMIRSYDDDDGGITGTKLRAGTASSRKAVSCKVEEGENLR